MDVLARLAALQGGGKQNGKDVMNPENKNDTSSEKQENEDKGDKEANVMLDEKELHISSLSIDNGDENTVNVDMECVGASHIGEHNDGVFSINQRNEDEVFNVETHDKEHWGGGFFNTNKHDGVAEYCEKENKELENFTFKSNIEMQTDLIQFWSPGIQQKMEKKPTPKSRFQPKRKSSSKEIDYSDTKAKKTGRFLKMFKKKDDSSSRKANKNLRVSRRSVMEVSKMKKLRKQTREHRLRNEKNMKLALQSGGFVPVRTTHVTKTKEFNFSMCNKVKEHTMSTRSNTAKPFESKLRKDSALHDYKNENTKPAPFKFTLPEKLMGQKDNWVSFAQAAMKFQTKTPTRYHNKPSEKDKSFLEKKPPQKVHITMPITPKLLTRGRSRRYKVEAAKELEEKEIEKMINYKFKASEFNPKIVEMKGLYGVKSVPVHVSTEVKPFNFEIEQRISNRTIKDTTLLQEDNLEKSKITSCGDKLKPTQPKPFSFENKDKERYTKKEEKIKEQLIAEKKMHDFQAGLLPSFSPDVLPAVATKKSTKLKPFNISDGSASYQAKLDLTMKMEADEERAKRLFKAKPANVVKKQPFQPIPGLIPPTNISNIMLNTDARAEERGSQQYWKMQKEKLEEEERLELEKEKEKEKKLAEEAEIKEFRRKAVHKAKPIRNFKPLHIKKSELPLTQPETPNLEVKKRALARLGDSRGSDRF